MHSPKKSLALSAAALSTVALGSPVTFALTPRGLVRRDLTEVTCGLYASADAPDTGSKNLVDIAQRFGQNLNVAAHTCHRIACVNTSGVYVCNDQDVDIDMPYQDTFAALDYLFKACGGGPGSPDGISGRVKDSQHGGFNVNIAYCNGNDAINVPPNFYEWPGPDGEPAAQCGKAGFPPCQGTECKKGSIKMEEPEEVSCGDYLGAGFVEPSAIYTYSTQQSIGTTWSVGGFLSIDTSDLAPISVQVGFFYSFAETQTFGSSTGVSVTCGSSDAKGDFTCGLLISPACLAMKGTCETEDTGTVPWAVVTPKLSSTGQPQFGSEICTCDNCPDATNSAAPEKRCGITCGACV